jgi:hypothetical protein
VLAPAVALVSLQHQWWRVFATKNVIFLWASFPNIVSNFFYHFSLQIFYAPQQYCKKLLFSNDPAFQAEVITSPAWVS